MASRKNIKKDIDLLTSELVSYCLFKKSISESDSSSIDAVAENILRLRIELRKKANRPTKSSSKAVKETFDEIATKMIEAIENGFKQIDSL